MTAELLSLAIGISLDEQLELVNICAQKLAASLPGNIDVEDLIQAGREGLRDAQRKFDPDRKFKFKTYAEFRIRGAMLDFLRSGDFVPRTIRDKQKRLEAANRVLEFKLGRRPDAEELGEQMGLTPEQIYKLERQTAPSTLLPFEEAPDWAAADRRSLVELITGGESVEERMVNRIHHKRRLEIVAAYVKRQIPRTRIVLDMYFFQGQRLKAIGRQLKISESRCSQLIQKHLGELRTRLERYENGRAA